MFEFTPNTIVQLIGYVGAALGILGFQLNNRKNIIAAQTASLFIFAIHLFLLKAYSGAVIELLGIFRNYTYIKYRKKYKKPLIPIIVIAIFSLATAVTWDGVTSLLPLVGMSFGAIAFWQTNSRNIRLITLLGLPPWFIYFYLISSFSGMLLMMFLFSSVVVAIIRYDILQKPEPILIKDKLKLGD